MHCDIGRNEWPQNEWPAAYTCTCGWFELARSGRYTPLAAPAGAGISLIVAGRFDQLADRQATKDIRD